MSYAPISYGRVALEKKRDKSMGREDFRIFMRVWEEAPQSRQMNFEYTACKHECDMNTKSTPYTHQMGKRCAG